MGNIDSVNEEPPNVDVPLENQTRECLIALVESMDKQAKDNEKRRAALEELFLVADDLGEQPGSWDRFYHALEAVRKTNPDALTPAPKVKS